MTITTLLMILALAIGPGTNQSIETNSTCPIDRVCKIGNNCWINGVWYNPCPSNAPSDPAPEPAPIFQPPS